MSRPPSSKLPSVGGKDFPAQDEPATIPLSDTVRPSAQLSPLRDGMIVAIHVWGWLWVLLWLLGLGGAVRFVWQRWQPDFTPVAS